MKRPIIITEQTPPTWLDYVATAAFWGFVIGWPLFVTIWRWLKR